MLSRRNIEIITAVIILIALLILLWFLFKKPKPPVENMPTDQAVQTDTLPKVNPASVPAPGVVSASTVARTFIERFGSYSSESDFANVDDILDLATSNYQQELESVVAGYRRQFASETGYSGVSTYVITMKNEAESETAASFLITTQREEAVGNPGNTSVRYQDAEVSLVKIGEDWLIDDLTWK